MLRRKVAPYQRLVLVLAPSPWSCCWKNVGGPLLWLHLRGVHLNIGHVRGSAELLCGPATSARASSGLHAKKWGVLRWLGFQARVHCKPLLQRRTAACAAACCPCRVVEALCLGCWACPKEYAQHLLHRPLLECKGSGLDATESWKRSNDFQEEGVVCSAMAA
jgi:hypothetical protein